MLIVMSCVIVAISPTRKQKCKGSSGGQHMADKHKMVRAKLNFSNGYTVNVRELSLLIINAYDTI